MYLTIKRILDIICSFFLLIVASPIIVSTILLLLLLRHKVFFFQKRGGKGNSVFTIIKFRTMTDKRDERGNLLPDTQRMFKLGNLIRKISIDELPQLLNVIKGDMSIIGPRPLLAEYLPIYNDFQKRRHEVKPGITGWAQVNGRNRLSWEQKFLFDIWYVDNLSFKVDLMILLITIKRIINKSITDDNEIITEYFK